MYQLYKNARSIPVISAKSKCPFFTFEPHDFDDFELIGEGTFGSVYKCFDKTLNKVVALKRVMKSGTQISREFTIHSNLRRNNANCVELLDFFMSETESGNLIQNFVLEYYPYTLERLVRNKLLTYSQIKYIMHSILQSLYDIHKSGYLHRDLKLDNIFISADMMEIKIGDFGAAKEFRQASPSYPTRYAHCYRAPQLILGADIHDGSSDMWALGCIFFQIVTRIQLFKCGFDDIRQLCIIMLRRGGITRDAIRGILNHISQNLVAKYVAHTLLQCDQFSTTRSIQSLFRYASCPRVPESISYLMEYMLAFNPDDRISAQKALEFTQMHFFER